MTVSYDGVIQMYCYNTRKLGMESSKESIDGQGKVKQNIWMAGDYYIELEDDEHIVSSCICKEGRYMAMTSYTGEFCLYKLYFFIIEREPNEGKLHVTKVDQIDYSEFAFSRRMNSYISDMNMSLYYQEYPLLFGI